MALELAMIFFHDSGLRDVDTILFSYTTLSSNPDGMIDDSKVFLLIKRV